MKFFEFTTKMSKFTNFPNFDNQVTILEHFQKITLIRKPIVSGLKSVTAGSASERYQTRFCAQFSRNSFENVKLFSDVICEIINIQKAPSKITRYGENLRKVKGRKPENDPKTKMKRGIFHNHQDNSSVPKYQK